MGKQPDLFLEIFPSLSAAELRNTHFHYRRSYVTFNHSHSVSLHLIELAIPDAIKLITYSHALTRRIILKSSFTQILTRKPITQTLFEVKCAV